MQSNQTLTRRLVPALAVTVVATLVFGAVVVTADVADGAEPLLPETFAVAAPRQGDAWRYNVTLTGGWTFGAEDEVRLNDSIPFGAFQWAGTGKVRGGDGLMHDANLLYGEHLAYEPLYYEEHYDSESSSGTQAGCVHVEDEYDYEFDLCPSEAPYWGTTTTRDWVLAGSQGVVSRGEYYAYNESNTQFGPFFGTGVMNEYSDAYESFAFIEFPKDQAPCLAFNPLQVGNVSLARPVELFQSCRLGGEFLQIPAGLRFEAQRVENLTGGVQAVLFEGRLNGTYRAWFTPAVPYPVRFEADLPSLREAEIGLGSRDLPGARSLRLDLVGFAAGGQDLLALDDAIDPAPALAFEAPDTAQAPAVAATVRGGPADGGIVHPFPLSVALEAALASETYNDIDSYLESQPGAYVAAAAYTEGDDVYFSETSAMPGEYAYVWSVLLHNGGQESFLFTAALVDYGNSAPLAVQDAIAATGQAPPTYQFRTGADFYRPFMPYGDMFYYGVRAPYPSQIPDAMPTAQSLMDRWAAFDASGTPANAYGFSIGCSDADQEECDVEVRYFAGHSRQSHDAGAPFFPVALPNDPYGNEETVVIERQVSFEQDGRASSLTVYDERSYRSASGPSPLPDPSQPSPIPLSEPGYHVQSTEVSGIPSSSVQWLPDAKEAASVTFLGIVVGALYWIWPKLGLVGLFSRLHRGELLDHPARARLVQIVESQPGIHFHDLAGKAELANGTAVHHLRKLTDSGHLSARRTGRYTCYFPGGRVDPHVAAAAPLLKSDGAKQVLEAVRAKPGLSNLEVAQATGLQPSTVNYHVQRLSQAGLVAALRDGRSVRLHPGIRAGVGGPADPAPSAGAAA